MPASESWQPGNGAAISHEAGYLRYVNPHITLGSGEKAGVATLNENWTNNSILVYKFSSKLEVTRHHLVQLEDFRSQIDYPRIYAHEGGALVAGIFVEKPFADPFLWLGNFNSDLELLWVKKLRIQPTDIDYFYPRWLKMDRLEAGYRFYIQSSQRGPYEGLVVLNVDENFEPTKRVWMVHASTNYLPLAGQDDRFSVVGVPGHNRTDEPYPAFRRIWFDRDLNQLSETTSEKGLGGFGSIAANQADQLRILGSTSYRTHAGGERRSRMSRRLYSPKGELLSVETFSDFDEDWRFVSLRHRFERTDGSVVYVASARQSGEDPRVVLLLKDKNGKTLNKCVWGRGRGIFLSAAQLDQSGRVLITGNRARSFIWVASVDPERCESDRPRWTQLTR